ncbi:MAG: hypothetical protein ACLU3F_03935 [Blautia wexlerae]
MKKRILSGILALTMCFSMTPSIAWGSGMTEFSDGGASGETEREEGIYRRAGGRGGERTAGNYCRSAGGGKWVQ